MALTPRDVIARENATVLEMVAGVPMTPATPESRTDPRNPNAAILPSDAERSSAGSNAESNPAPRHNAHRLRLVWCAPSNE